MPETRTDEPSLSWPTIVAASGADGLTPLEQVISDEILPRLSTVNRPTKIMDTSGMFWTPLKSRGVRGARVGEHFRVYTREGTVIGGRDGEGTSLTSDLAEQILLTKSSVKQHLVSAGLPVPEGRLFSGDEKATALAYAESHQGLVVVKPNGRTAGVGVSTGVQGGQQFDAAWRSAVAASSQAQPRRPWDRELRTEEAIDRILVEPDDAGVALRVFVTGEKVVGAVVRLPMFVIGDGSRSIGELTAELVEWRARHAFLKRLTPRQSVLERSLERLGLAPHATPAPGAVCRLQESPNIHGGGISLDVTDRIDRAVENLAIEARWAVPGMLTAGVDISVPLVTSSEAVVVGVNDRPSLHLHMYPTFGVPRRVTQGIVDLFVQRA